MAEAIQEFIDFVKQEAQTQDLEIEEFEEIAQKYDKSKTSRRLKNFIAYCRVLFGDLVEVSSLDNTMLRYIEVLTLKRFRNSKKNNIHVVEDVNGNLVHVGTNIVFKNNKVVGYIENNTVQPLDMNHKIICEINSWEIEAN
jgi:hypothetical protein